MLPDAAGMVHTEEAKVDPPPLPPFYIGLRQREAWVNHELLLNHA